MTHDEIISMAKKFGLATWHNGLKRWTLEIGLEQFTAEVEALATTAERRKHQADIERWKAEAATAEKWRGLALSKDGDGRCVQRIQQEAAEKEREACAKAVEDMAERYAMGSIEERLMERAAEAIRSRSTI